MGLMGAWCMAGKIRFKELCCHCSIAISFAAVLFWCFPYPKFNGVAFAEDNVGDYYRYEENGFSCHLPSQLIVTDKYPEFGAENGMGVPYQDILIKLIGDSESASADIAFISTWQGDSDLMGKKTYLYRMGKFSGTWHGDEILIIDYIYATKKTFYNWQVLLKIKDTYIKVQIRGDEDFNTVESMWLNIINSIKID